MSNEIKQITASREIPYLLHFTRSENLPSIMEKGLIPRSEIDCGNCQGLTNDALRLDNRRDYNCLSIAFPNAPMFFRFRNEAPGVEWPILVIHPAIMAVSDTLFCWTNAASAEMIHAPSDTLKSKQAYEELFIERPGMLSRADQFLKICDPTDVQAEVLVKGVIPPKAIYYVIFPSHPCQSENKPSIGDRKSIVSNKRGFYGTRQYYRQWGHGK